MAVSKQGKPKGGSPKDRPIIVAVDFSDDSRAALIWALEAAEKFSSPLIVLHVVHDPGEAPGYYRKDEKDLLRPMEEVAEKMMRKFIKKVRSSGVSKKSFRNLRTKLVKGVPVTRIIEFSEKADAAMIVMGSQGRTGLSRLMLGSKAEQVVRLSPVPVTIIKAAKDTKKKSK